MWALGTWTRHHVRYTPADYSTQWSPSSLIELKPVQGGDLLVSLVSKNSGRRRMESFHAYRVAIAWRYVLATWGGRPSRQICVQSILRHWYKSHWPASVQGKEKDHWLNLRGAQIENPLTQVCVQGHNNSRTSSISRWSNDHPDLSIASNRPRNMLSNIDDFGHRSTYQTVLTSRPRHVSSLTVQRYSREHKSNIYDS